MAISKNSVRVQFTLNKNKEKEKQISEFLDECIDPNSYIKEIIYSYIVSNRSTQLPLLSNSKIVNSDVKRSTVSNFNDNPVKTSEKVTHYDEKSTKVSELELNELEELNKFR